MKHNQGFTLIELMIVVAIVAVLTAIAYPSYQSYIKRTNRTETQTIMMEIAQKLQAYKLVNGDYGVTNSNSTYASNPLLNPGVYGTTVSPSSNKILYNLTLTGSPKSSWTLTATPNSGSAQTGDGHIVINHRGERCWTKGSDKNDGTVCVPSATTNWDGR